MHRTAVWQYSSNSNIKIVHNSIEHFLWNPSDFSSDDVLSCLWIVFTNSVFQVPPKKIPRRFEFLGIAWPGVMVLTWNVSVPWEDMPEVFRCSVWKVRCHLNNSDITSYWTDSFHVMYLLLAIALFVTNLNLSRLFRRPLWGGGRGVYKHIYSFRKYTF